MVPKFLGIFCTLIFLTLFYTSIVPCVITFFSLVEDAVFPLNFDH
jgi:hypothetical protein